jgi:hypothetical protein
LHSELLATVIHPSQSRVERRQEDLIIPALARIEESQNDVQAGQILILKDLYALKAESLSKRRNPLKSSTLISVLERADIKIQLFATRGNARRFGVLARLTIGNSHALVVEVSGRYFTIPLFFHPRVSITLNGIIPDNSPIVIACKGGDAVTVKQLLEGGAARPNDYTPTNQSLLAVFYLLCITFSCRH